SQRVADRLRHDKRRSKMDDGLNAVFADQTRDKDLITNIANDEGHTLRNLLAKARRKIIEDHDWLPYIEEPEDHVSPDIAGSAGYQQAHEYWLLHNPNK